MAKASQKNVQNEKIKTDNTIQETDKTNSTSKANGYEETNGLVTENAHNVSMGEYDENQTSKNTINGTQTGTEDTTTNKNGQVNINSENISKGEQTSTDKSNGYSQSTSISYKQPITDTPVYSPTGIRDSSTSLSYDTSYKDQALEQMNQGNEYINNALNQLQQLSNNSQNLANSYQKQDYSSKYQSTIDGLLDKILNREEFSYDFNADPMYNLYKDQYTKLGNEASMNAVANASAMTGGYGNSYAATAGAMANQQYMTQLNNMIPQLYQAALDKYNTDTENLYNQYSAVGSAEDRLYQQYRDDVSDSQWENQYKYNASQDAINNYYNQTNLGSDAYNNAINNLLGLNSNELSIGQTNLSASQWADSMEEEQNQFGTQLSQQQWEALLHEINSTDTTTGEEKYGTVSSNEYNMTNSTEISNESSSAHTDSENKNTSTEENETNKSGFSKDVTDSESTQKNNSTTNSQSTQENESTTDINKTEKGTQTTDLTSNTTSSNSGSSGTISSKGTSGSGMSDEQIQKSALDIVSQINNAFDQMIKNHGLPNGTTSKAEYEKLVAAYTKDADPVIVDKVNAFKRTY